MRKLLWFSLAVVVMGSTAGCVIDDTYASCFDTSDYSDVDDQCIEVIVPAAATAGRFCTHGCSGDFDCEDNFGFSGACYDVERSGVPLCFQRCEIHADCYSTSVCIQVALGGGLIDFICLPDN